MAYLDLAEADELVRGSRLLSRARIGPASFRAEDHSPEILAADDPARLAAAVRRYAGGALGRELPAGPTRVLTQLRQFGLFFSPLNLFVCIDGKTNRPDAIVAEVSNTPWNQRRLYVLDAAGQVNPAAGLRFRHAKDFHVSPFMSIEADYHWRISEFGPRAAVAIRSVGRDRPPFTATMTLQRQAWSDRALAANLIRFPVSGAQTLAAIYWQALQLWIKRCPFYPHPRVPAESQPSAGSAGACSR